MDLPNNSVTMEPTSLSRTPTPYEIPQTILLRMVLLLTTRILAKVINSNYLVGYSRRARTCHAQLDFELISVHLLFLL